MSINTVAGHMIEYVEKLPNPVVVDAMTDSTSRPHLMWMIQGIQIGRVTGEKAHRWMGWIQACIVMQTGVTLEDMKRINQSAHL